MKAVAITEEARLSGLGDPIGQAESQLAKAIAGKVDSDLLTAALATKNTYTGTDPISYAGIVAAATQFGDEEDGIEKVLFIHPEQEAALLTDNQFLSADKFEAGVAVRGSIGKVAGCWVKKSKKITTTGSGTSKKYNDIIIKLQPDNPESDYTEDELPALTIFLKQDTKVDADFKPRTQTTEITASKYYGAAMTNEAKVIKAQFFATKQA